MTTLDHRIEGSARRRRRRDPRQSLHPRQADRRARRCTTPRATSASSSRRRKSILDELVTRAPSCRRCSTCRTRRSSTSSSRRGRAARSWTTILYLQESLEHIVAATNPLPRRMIENLFRRARHLLTQRCADGERLNANFRQSALFRRVGRAHRRAGPAPERPRLSAADDPHAGRQFARGLHLLDRARCDASRRSTSSRCRRATRSPASPCCGPWRTSIPTIRS